MHFSIVGSFLKSVFNLIYIFARVTICRNRSRYLQYYLSYKTQFIYFVIFFSLLSLTWLCWKSERQASQRFLHTLWCRKVARQSMYGATKSLRHESTYGNRLKVIKLYDQNLWNKIHTYNLHEVWLYVQETRNNDETAILSKLVVLS